jgi:hypothetical protein
LGHESGCSPSVAFRAIKEVHHANRAYQFVRAMTGRVKSVPSRACWSLLSWRVCPESMLPLTVTRARNIGAMANAVPIGLAIAELRLLRSTSRGGRHRRSSDPACRALIVISAAQLTENTVMVSRNVIAIGERPFQSPDRSRESAVSPFLVHPFMRTWAPVED